MTPPSSIDVIVFFQSTKFTVVLMENYCESCCLESLFHVNGKVDGFTVIQVQIHGYGRLSLVGRLSRTHCLTISLSMVYNV